MTSFFIDYKDVSTELCYIGSKYDTDKSSQRQHVTDMRHCHPYTIFYDALFSSQRDNPIVIAELGILEGSSLRMWHEYFQKATIHGFEYNEAFIKSFGTMDRVTVKNINVQDTHSIETAFSNTNALYDLIIDDTTHQFEDQIRIILNTYSSLKPGGMMIIEDIFLHYDEATYIERIKSVLDQFQSYYFVTLDHKRKCSTGWNNDKLFILIKNGKPSIFSSKPVITYITPSIRPQNLKQVHDSMRIGQDDRWMIIYDGSKIETCPNLFEGNKQINEYIYKGDGTSGNPQRNFALDILLKENYKGMIYYLDDDNEIHPDFYKMLTFIHTDKLYSFDQKNRIKGNIIKSGNIDTAMVLINFSLCNDERWIPYLYEADGEYITACFNKNKNQHIYINNDLCQYNTIKDSSQNNTCKVIEQYSFQKMLSSYTINDEDDE